MESLIPGLTDDIALLCLIRVPSVSLSVVGSVSKTWKRLVENEDFLRRHAMFHNMMLLKSSDDKVFEVNHAVAFKSLTIKNMIQDRGIDNPLHLPNVSGKILAKVIEYCKYHVDAAKSAVEKDDVKVWDQEFVKVDDVTFFDLVQAAYDLNIKNLQDFTCQTVADMIKGKTPEEIRRTFNIKNLFTPEEEEKVRRENRWAFE